MPLSLQHCSIVIVGYWNRMIFSPSWVAEKLLKVREVESLASLDRSVPVIMRSRGIELLLTETRLQIKPTDEGDEFLRAAEEVAKTAASLLPNTPVSAVGINFGTKNSRAERLIELFNYRDDGDLHEAGWEIRACSLKRELHHNNEVLKLSMVLEDGEAYILGNFHRSVQNCPDVVPLLENRAVDLSKSFEQLIETVYGEFDGQEQHEEIRQ